MAYVRIIGEDEASGELKRDYEWISETYSKALGVATPTPQVYLPNSLLPAYFHLAATHFRVLTDDGRHPEPEVGVPHILVNFAVSMYSACFY